MGDGFLRLIPIGEAQKIIDANVPKFEGSEMVSLMDASSRILFEDLYAPIDLPPWDRALMDGYALVAEDTFGASEEVGIRFKVLGSLRAGDSRCFEVGGGEVVEIATGAPIPQGADAILMVEHTDRVSDEEVIAHRSVVPGENIQVRGADIRKDDLVFRKGERIHPREIGVFAALGLDQIKVVRKPKVAVISTGDELELPGKKLTPGKVFDANTYMITTKLLDLGADAIFKGRVRDKFDELIEAVSGAIEEGFDIIILSGGTSAGKGDILYRVVENLGELLIHGVMIKPGKPFIFGICKGVCLFGLPGYPVSAMITFEKLIEPVIRDMTRIEPRDAGEIRARMGCRLHSAKGRYEFIPVKLDRGEDGGEYIATPVFGGSGAIRTLIDLDGYIAVEEEVEIIDKDEYVDVVKR